MHIVYISGPISNGGKDSSSVMKNNRAKAKTLAMKLWNIKDIYVICPHLNSPWESADEFSETGMAYAEMISKDCEILKKCDCVIMMKDWETSKGSKLEYEYAINNKIPVFHEDDIEELEVS